MTAAGQCWELPILGRRTKGKDSGCSHRWLFPTPTCNPEAPNHGSNSNGPHNLKEVALNGWKPGQMWPTPTVCGNYNRKGASATSGDGLATAVAMSLTMNCSGDTDAQIVKVWPTPDAHMGSGGRTSKSPPTGKRANGTKQQITLNDAVKWRTPNATDGAKWSNQTQAEREAKGQQVRLGHQIGAGGSLNPTWVEWLMAWPLGWTDLKPLEMGRFPYARQKRSEC